MAESAAVTEPSPTARIVRWAYLGRVEYARAVRLQRALLDARAEGAADDTLLLVEHPPVITLGRRGSRDDVLVNAAGISDRAAAAEMRPDQWDRVIRVDLTGTFYCCRALHAALVAGRGTVVNIASIAAHRAFAGRANYCAAKAGVVALTEVLGLEWAATGVRVVAVSPGFVATPLAVAGMQAGWIEEEALLGRTPQRRLARPEEIANTYAWLASDEASYINGAVIEVSGGVTI